MRVILRRVRGMEMRMVEKALRLRIRIVVFLGGHS